MSKEFGIISHELAWMPQGSFNTFSGGSGSHYTYNGEDKVKDVPYLLTRYSFLKMRCRLTRTCWLAKWICMAVKCDHEVPSIPSFILFSCICEQKKLNLPLFIFRTLLSLAPLIVMSCRSF